VALYGLLIERLVGIHCQQHLEHRGDRRHGDLLGKTTVIVQLSRTPYHAAFGGPPACYTAPPATAAPMVA